MMFVDENGLIRVIATNGTEAIAKGAAVTITLPVSFTFVSADQTVVQASNILTRDLGDFAISDTDTVNVTVTPTEAGTFVSEADIIAQNPTTSPSVVHDEYTHTVHDRRSCAVATFGADGGGDTFDCYPEGNLVDVPFLAGTGFSSNWKAGDFLTVYGDDFESYALMDPLTGSLTGGTGFTGGWLYD